jgi:hypothetical protein
MFHVANGYSLNKYFDEFNIASLLCFLSETDDSGW